MTGLEVGRLRLLAQGVCGAQPSTPAGAVRHMAAMQGQDWAQVTWAIATRTPDATLADVEEAFASGRIVRTWPLRGTLHVVPAEDAGWMVAWSAPRMLARDARRMAELAIDGAVLGRCEKAVQRALEGGKALPRDELLAALDRAGIATAQQRGYRLLWCAAQTGLVCLGPPRDGEQRFVLLDEWVKRPRKLAGEEATVELARRYVEGHAPATADDFAWWAALPLTQAKRALEAAGLSLVARTFEGRTWWSPRDAAPTRGARAKAHLLAGFDELILGYTDRSAILPPEHASKIVPGGNGVFKPTIVRDGRTIGTWGRRVTKKGVAITLTPFARTPGIEAAVRASAERYAAFLGFAPGALTVTVA